MEEDSRCEEAAVDRICPYRDLLVLDLRRYDALHLTRFALGEPNVEGSHPGEYAHLRIYEWREWRGSNPCVHDLRWHVQSTGSWIDCLKILGFLRVKKHIHPLYRKADELSYQAILNRSPQR